MNAQIDPHGKKVERSELVNSFSRHAKLSNRYMTGILLVSVTIAMNLKPLQKIDLPLIGTIKEEFFYFVSIAILSCLIVLFSSSHLMALRIRGYYNLFFVKRNDKDFIDLTVEPTIFRMAPISWMIKNRNVYYINLEDANVKWKKIEFIIYYILKLFVLITTYIFPGIVLVIAVINSTIYKLSFDNYFILRVFLFFLTIMSLISFTVVLTNEIKFIFKSHK